MGHVLIARSTYSTGNRQRAQYYGIIIVTLREKEKKSGNYDNSNNRTMSRDKSWTFQSICFINAHSGGQGTKRAVIRSKTEIWNTLKRKYFLNIVFVHQSITFESCLESRQKLSCWRSYTGGILTGLLFIIIIIIIHRRKTLRLMKQLFLNVIK